MIADKSHPRVIARNYSDFTGAWGAENALSGPQMWVGAAPVPHGLANHRTPADRFTKNAATDDRDICRYHARLLLRWFSDRYRDRGNHLARKRSASDGIQDYGPPPVGLQSVERWV